ncbi:unnamed protein product, partial [Hymenolepis diminuta]
KYIYTHFLAHPYPSDSYKVVFVFYTRTAHACQLPVPTLPAHLLSSSARSSLPLSAIRFKLVMIALITNFGLINSWSSALQLLALTQAATN